MVQPTTDYRITVNSFLADGGDGFAVLLAGRDRLGGAVDTDALEGHFTAAGGPVAPGPRNRITLAVPPPVIPESPVVLVLPLLALALSAALVWRRRRTAQPA